MALGSAALVAFVGIAAQAPTTALAASQSHPAVLRVGSYHGIPGQFTSIQAAVCAAHPGDWVLVGPGDYHEQGYLSHGGAGCSGYAAPRDAGGTPTPAGVLVETPGIHLRGMDRNGVVVDGTRPGASRCSSSPSDQVDPLTNRSPAVAHGLNGVEVYGTTKRPTDGTYVENLTTCNFLTDSKGEGGGNEIWWNGGQGTGTVGIHTFWGNYLTATSTSSRGVAPPFGLYGIYADNVGDVTPGASSINHGYASNMGDAAFYIGGCPDCDTVLNDAHAQNSALGFSGTNSGGDLVIENSQFDHNKTGFTANSQNNDDLPSPQNGACPKGETGPLGNDRCTFLESSRVYDNNNPNVPGGSGSGLASGAPVGTGVVLAGTRHYTLYRNDVYGNGAWGAVVTDLPDQETPPPNANPPCQGGFAYVPAPGAETCYYQAFGNEVLDNTFWSNGSFGNPTNGDIAMSTLPHDPGNCFVGNQDSHGKLTTDPSNLQSPPYNSCSNANGGDTGLLVAELACATQLFAPCPQLPGASYPRPTKVTDPYPPAADTPTMPDACQGVPSNPWCSGTTAARAPRSGGGPGANGALPQDTGRRVLRPVSGGPGASALPGPWRPRAPRRV